jgi:hypothetical protein
MVAASLAAACVFSASAATVFSATGAELKPIAVGSFSGYDALFGDIETLGKVSGNPDLASGLEAMLKFATRSHGLVGLDKTKPWGAAVYPTKPHLTTEPHLTDSKPPGYIFLPVTDLDKLLAVLEPFIGKPESVGDGVLKLTRPEGSHDDNGKVLFVKQQGSWAIISKKQANLALAPDDPGELLGDLPKNYDLAVRIEAADIPSALREQFIDKMAKDVAKDLKRRRGEDDREHAVRQRVTRELVKTIKGAVNDVEQITLGWTLDNETEKTYADLIVLAKSGSDTQKQLARWTTSKTRFAGFHMAEAAFACSWSGQLTDSEADTVKSVLEAAHAKAIEDIEKKGKSKSKSHQNAAKAFVGELFDVIGGIAGSKRLDGAVSLLLEPDSATLLAAEYVPGAAKLENLARQFADLVADDHPEVKDFVTVKANIEEYQGVRFHAVSMPIPDDAENRDKVVALIGETLEVVLGIGEDSVYLAAGREPLATLKKAIAASIDSSIEVPPLRMSIGLRSLAGFLAEMADSEDERTKASILAKILGKAENQDHLVFTAAPVAGGLRLRLEVEGGIVKAIGAMSTMLPPGLMDK